jgi:uncharacterized membrane protein
MLYVGTDPSSVDYPDAHAVNTQLTDLNDRGVAVGAWSKSDFVWKGFVFDTIKNTFTTIDVPGATTVLAYGMNNAGLVAINTNSGPYIYCPDGVECPGLESR